MATERMATYRNTRVVDGGSELYQGKPRNLYRVVHRPLGENVTVYRGTWAECCKFKQQLPGSPKRGKGEGVITSWRDLDGTPRR